MWALAAILFWLALRAIYDDYLTVDHRTTVDALSEGDYVVQEVGEGFTLVVQRPVSSLPSEDPRNQGRDGRIQARVKLLGVRSVSGFDEASLAEFSAQAKQWMEGLVGRVVRLRLDRRRWDENHVFLAYVYLEDQLVNAQLLREGLARLDVHAADVAEVVRQLRQAEEEARTAQVGCWR